MKLTFYVLFLLSPIYLQAQWSSFCEGNTNGFIVKLAEHQDEIYAGGFFTQICGESIQYVSKWNGEDWEAVANGLADPVHNLRSINGTLYAAKYELQVDSNWVYYLDELNNEWKKLGDGFYLTTALAGFSQTPSIYDIIEYNGDLIVSGEFDRAGNEEVHGIARWDGNKWLPLESGLQSNIANTAPVIFPHEMILFENDLIVVGNFAQAGGLTANGVARWNGTAWQNMGTGFNGTVYSVGIYNGELYVGGDFSQSGTESMLRIAKWESNTWTNIGIGFNGFVHTLESINGQLYALGGFNHLFIGTVGFQLVDHIVQFNGTDWNVLDGGLDFDAEAIVPFGNGVLVGGGFDFADGDIIVNHLALWADPTDISVLSKQETISITPNPSNGIIHIHTNGIEIREGMLNIYHTSGKKVFSANTFQTVLDLSHLPKGIYYLEIILEENGIGQQFVIH